jgi:signal transduction histidine kinase
VAAVGALLLGVQLVLAARLARRIGALHAYLPRLREGQSEPAPPPDGSGDELAALRDGLYEAARQLERSRAERERGLADAAHDLRTPLGVIRTTIDLALRRPRSEAELRSALGEVKAECLRLGALTDEILAQRRGARQREPVDLAAVVGAAARGIEPLADEAGVELRVQLPRPRRAATGAAVGAAAAAAARDSAPASARDSAPASARDSAPASARISAPTSASVSRGGPLEAPVAPLLGDAGALRRLVDNLLHNAITYSPRRGRVDVELSDGGAELRLEVRDQGPGFSEEQLERVFLPFVRGDDSRGAGLGLAIVRQVATEHGGAAWAEPGPGGRVVVTLPAARRRGEDAAEPAADADAADADAADAAAAS